MDLEFEVPFRELTFDGVPHKTAVKLLPTVNCLVELTEMPFTVITLTEVGIMSLERVGFALKNFDLAIVFKVTTPGFASHAPCQQLQVEFARKKKWQRRCGLQLDGIGRGEWLLYCLWW